MMEMTALPYGVLTKPVSFFFNHGVLSQNPQKNMALTSNAKSNVHSNSSRGTSKPVFELNALNVPRQTPSSNWDFMAPSFNDYSGSSTVTSITPSSLPRLEDLDATNMLLRQRIVFLGSMVDDMAADFIINQLLLLDAEDSKKDITLFINSPGGSITAGMGIYDAMKMCKADVSTVCFGLAASMGAFLLASGTKGKRYCMPNARVMIHEPITSFQGQAVDLIIHVKEVMYYKNKLNKILSRITGKPEEQIELDTRSDYFMDAWEAKEYGLVDAVMDNGKPGLVAPRTDTAPPPFTDLTTLIDFGDYNLKTIKNLPTEEKLLQNGYLGEGSDSGDGGNDQWKETPTSV